MKVLKDIRIVKVKEVAIVTEGEATREVGEGEEPHTLVTGEGEKVTQTQPHSIGTAVREGDKGTVEGGEGEEGVDPLISIDQGTIDIRGPTVVLHSSNYSQHCRAHNCFMHNLYTVKIFF